MSRRRKLPRQSKRGMGVSWDPHAGSPIFESLELGESVGDSKHVRCDRRANSGSACFRCKKPGGYLCMACVAVGLTGVLHAQQTSGKRVSVMDVSQITDAVMISNVSVAGKTVECGLFIEPPIVIQPVTPFEAAGDWLRQTTISLINRTSKTIVFAEINLHFLDTGDCRTLPCVGVQLRLGRTPAVDAYDGRTGRPLRPETPDRPTLDWKPEQTIVVHVSDYLPEIEEDLADFLPVMSVRNVNVYRGVFYFDDGIQWSLARYSVPDPEHPGKFKELPADYFPGKRGRNWPPGYSQ